MKTNIQMIPVNQIRIINPRHRDKKKFEAIVESIQLVGLKKPIQVSLRAAGEEAEQKYDLVCGQGRMEAFKAIGYAEIPAEVVALPKEERLLRSLVENIARRSPAKLALLEEIVRLKEQGYNHGAIATKLGMSESTISHIYGLGKAGEERLLEETLRGNIPLWVAIEISKIKDIDGQRELLKAYESKEVTRASIHRIKRVAEQRLAFGPKKQTGNAKPRTTRTSLVAIYKRECQRQQQMVNKANRCEHALTILFTAFKTLKADEDFMTLLRAEKLSTFPTCLEKTDEA